VAVLVLLVAACSQGTGSVATPRPSLSAAAPSPSPSPSPQPPQQQEAALPAAVEETGAAAAGGRLYVIGGFSAAGASLESVYVFDGGAWAVGPRLPIPVDHPSAATLDDRVYLAGGHSNGRDSARLFRLDSDHWTELASMHFARGGHALVAAGGRLYAIGGNSSRGNVGPIEDYDPGSNAWTVLPALPGTRNHVSGFAAGGAACAAGGRSPTTARVDCFDPAAGAWSRLPDLPQPASGAGATSFVSGDVVVTGGEDASETRIVDQLAFYSPGGSWTSTGKLMSPRHGFELAVFQGRAWACGGGTAPGLHPVATCTSIGDAPSSNS
jgi:N-acetylneuraminic acid mutarotase